MTQPLVVGNPYQMKQWNLAALIATLGGFAISRGAGASGYAADTAITTKRKNPSFKSTEGADGTVTVSSTNSRLTEIEIHTMQSNAPTNGFLSSALITAEAAGLVLALPLVIKDNNGTTYFSALRCWLVGAPDQDFKSDPGPRVWKFECIPEIYFVGGN